VEEHPVEFGGGGGQLSSRGHGVVNVMENRGLVLGVRGSWARVHRKRDVQEWESMQAGDRPSNCCKPLRHQITSKHEQTHWEMSAISATVQAAITLAETHTVLTPISLPWPPPPLPAGTLLRCGWTPRCPLLL